MRKEVPNSGDYEYYPVSSSLDSVLADLRRITGETADLLISELNIGSVRTAVVCFEGMTSGYDASQMVVLPIMGLSERNLTADELYKYVKERMILSVDTGEEELYGNIIRRLMSGFAVFFIDGEDKALCFGIQGYAARGIDEPSSEGNIMGAHEGFVETVRTNMSLIRRRIKSPQLQFTLFPISDKSCCDVIVCFMADRVPESLVKSICRRLKKIPLESILGSGYVAPFLEGDSPSVFRGLSTTERPDVMCAKLIEGRVGILIEGTPFGIVVPSLFVENFQTLDDYNFRPFYAAFLRYVRYIAFFLSVFFPGIYIAAALFHPQMFNTSLLINLAEAQKDAPLHLMLEAAITLIFYEIIREAGVRLPKSVGGAVSIVGGLIIGDAAVSAGIISNPVLLICAISVTASFVIPSLNQQISVFRLACVAAGGLTGLFGISLISALLLANICAAENFGLPVMAPMSPFSPFAMGDVAVRQSMRRLGRRGFTVEKLKGAQMDRAERGNEDEQ